MNEMNFNEQFIFPSVRSINTKNDEIKNINNKKTVKK